VVRHMVKSTIMLVGYIEVPETPVSWLIKAKSLRLYSARVASIHQLYQDVLAERLASPYQQQDVVTQSVLRNVPDYRLLEATLDAIVVERPSSTDEAPHHLCPNKGYDNEPSRDVLLERGYIAHIHSVGEEKDEAGQRRYLVRRWVVERTLGWLSKCRAILVLYEKMAAIASSVGLTSKALPILCSACPVLATWGIGSWVSQRLTLVGRSIAPGKEELATRYPRCPRGIEREPEAEKIAHSPDIPRVEECPGGHKLAHCPLGVFGFQVNDRRSSTTHLRHKPYRFHRDAQTPAGSHMLLLPVGFRELLQQPPPGLLPIRAYVPRQQQGPAGTVISRHPRVSLSATCIAP
jgi:hypothetical protein